MRWLAFCLLLMACNPLKSAKKHWTAIQDLLLKYPELADTLELIKRDTIRLQGFRDSVAVVNDSTVWGDDFFREVDTLASNVVKAPESKKAAPVTKLQRKLCPELERDTTYHIKVYNSVLTRHIPIQIHVHVKDGKASFSILADNVQIPEQNVIKSVEFKPIAPAFYRDKWFWLAVAMFLLVLALARRR